VPILGIHLSSPKLQDIVATALPPNIQLIAGLGYIKINLYHGGDQIIYDLINKVVTNPDEGVSLIYNLC
jgi:hypothetical protein